MDIRHKKSDFLIPKVNLIFDVSQVTENGKIGPPTMRLLSRSVSVPNKLKRYTQTNPYTLENITLLKTI